MPDGRGRFLRDNAFLLAAVSLPVVVVGFFLLASAIPRWTVPPPAYDLLLRAEGPYDHSLPRIAVDYVVVDGRVEATARSLPANTYLQPSTLWIFDHTTMSARRVPVDLPTTLVEGEPARTIVVDALSGRKVVADSRAPDGYELHTRSRGGSGLVGDLFGMRRYDRTVSIVNRGRVVRVSLPSPHQSPYGVHFVGWVLE